MSYTKARESVDLGSALQCAATGCPNVWTVDDGGARLCSAHHGAPARQWPQITSEQLDEVAERARWAAEPKPEPVQLTRAEKVDVLARLRGTLTDNATRNWRAWAVRLKERHRRGERLTRTQIEAYQAALSERVHLRGDDS